MDKVINFNRLKKASYRHDSFGKSGRISKKHLQSARDVPGKVCHRRDRISI